jgi:high-affinity nickel-transport protein
MASGSHLAPSLLSRIRESLSPRERAAVAGMAAFVCLLHLAGWGVLAWVVTTQNLQAGPNGAFGLGLGLAAYTLGLRHAFDADHISAIDNTTRKLMQSGARPLSVGFWFSLGHSTVVLGLCALVGGGVQHLVERSDGDAGAVQEILGVAGTGVSGIFLYIIGAANLVILLGIVKVFRQMRHGDLDEPALEAQLNKRGLANRVFGRATRVITRPRQMYAVGLLFGLGFDTATEVALLMLAGGAAAYALPWYAILTLPVLFAAGMSLLDTLDGCFMNFAYGWAFSRPVRKIYYNMVITGLSVTVALIIGSMQLVSILAQQAGLSQGPLAAVAGLDLNTVGYVLVAVFILAWLGALAVWRWGHVEEKWGAAPARITDPGGGQCM